MIEDTLRRLEERIEASEKTGDGTRRELLALVAELRREFADVAASHGDEAAAIAAHADRTERSSAVSGVEESMLEFESAHPKVVGLFHSLMRTLADAGL